MLTRKLFNIFHNPMWFLCCVGWIERSIKLCSHQVKNEHRAKSLNIYVKFKSNSFHCVLKNKTINYQNMTSSSKISFACVFAKREQSSNEDQNRSEVISFHVSWPCCEQHQWKIRSPFPNVITFVLCDGAFRTLRVWHFISCEIFSFCNVRKCCFYFCIFYFPFAWGKHSLFSGKVNLICDKDWQSKEVP